MKEIIEYKMIVDAVAGGLPKTHLAEAANMAESSVRKATGPNADPRLSTMRRLYDGYCKLKTDGKV